MGDMKHFIFGITLVLVLYLWTMALLAYSVQPPETKEFIVYPHLEIPGLVFLCKKDLMCIIVPKQGWQQYRYKNGNLTGISK